MQRDSADSAAFFETAIAAFLDRAGPTATQPLRILDFGCGAGDLVTEFRGRGHEAYGCDVVAGWETSGGRAADVAGWCRWIGRPPYVLPFTDRFFDAVVSTSVLEHSQNIDEVYGEIGRVLKHGGIALHLYPSKWYLPWEPHIYVPLANWLWPARPVILYWLAAQMGIRNEYQGTLSATETWRQNREYARTGLHYISERRHRQLGERHIGVHRAQSHFFLGHADGGVPRLYRRLGRPRWLAWLFTLPRMRFIVQRRTQEG